MVNSFFAPTEPIRQTVQLMFWQRLCRWVVGLLALTGFQRLEAANPPRLATVSINGQPYISVVGWSSLYNLSSRWDAKSSELRLTNRWTHLEFKADTRRVEVDDVSVNLSFPVLRVGDRLYLALRDEETVLRPLLKPPRLSAGRKITTIALSPGHGGKDPGHIEGSRTEKYYTLQLALEVQRLLQKNGFKVIMARSDDSYVSLEERPAIARKRGADLFLCLHFNSAGGAEAPQGLETYCLTPSGASSTNDRGNSGGGARTGNRWDHENLQLAYQLHRAILSEIDFGDRGVRHSRFKELALAEMPAAYIEGGFMSNREDAKRIFSEPGRTRFAAAIVDGIMAFKRMVERGQPE